MKRTMRKLLAVAIVAALVFGAWALGRREGIRHTIEDGHMFITSWDDCPADVPGGAEADLLMWIYLDGESHPHGLTIG